MARQVKRPTEQEFRHLMLEVGLTRKQLAAHYRVSNTTIDNWVHFFEIEHYGRWKLRPPTTNWRPYMTASTVNLTDGTGCNVKDALRVKWASASIQ